MTFWQRFIRKPLLMFFFVMFFLLSFPNFLSPYGFPRLMIVFLLPLMEILPDMPLLKRGLLGLFLGVVMYGALLYWLYPLHPAGYVIFVLLLSTQMVFFTLFYINPRQTFIKVIQHEVDSRSVTVKYMHPLFTICYLPCLWVVSEFFRSFLMGGFTWTIGHGWAIYHYMLALCPFVGSYSLSFIILLINVHIWTKAIYTSPYNRLTNVVIFFCLISALLWLNLNQMVKIGSLQESPTLRVCTIQPNTSPERKGNPKYLKEVLEENINLSKSCVEESQPAVEGSQPDIEDYRPDIVVWPETSIPDDIINNQEVYARLKDLGWEINSHLLIGMAEEEGNRNYNSVALLNPKGELKGKYRKIHLIPFVEYLPLSPFLSPLRSVLYKQDYEFFPGKEPRIFKMEPRKDGKKYNFSSLICSEEFYPGLFRKIAEQDVDFVVSLLNDQKLPKQGLYLHWQAAIIRAAEFGRLIIRSSNNGITCVISPYGKVTSSVKNIEEAINKKQISPYTIAMGKEETVYTLYGDLFPLFCLGFVLLVKFVERTIMKE